MYPPLQDFREATSGAQSLWSSTAPRGHKAPLECDPKYRVAHLRSSSVPSVGAVILWNNTWPYWPDPQPDALLILSLAPHLSSYGGVLSLASLDPMLSQQCPHMLGNTHPFDPVHPPPGHPVQVLNIICCCRAPKCAASSLYAP